MHQKQAWRSAARILLSAGALCAIFFVEGLGNVLSALARADFSLIGLAVLLSLLTRLAAAERTYVISRGLKLPLNRWQTLEAMFVSNFWSLALPGLSAGSVVTVYRYTQYGVTLTDGVGVLSASRAIELAAYCAMGAIAFALTSTSVNPGVTVALCFMPLAVAGIFIAAPRFAGSLPRSPSSNVAPARAFEKLTAIMARVLSAFGSVPRGKLLISLSFALFQCALDAATVLMLARSLDFQIAWLDALWINVLAYLAILLPISVAGLGVREAAVILTLTPLGVPRDGAIALALLMFGTTFVNALLGGVLQFFTRPRRPT